MSNLTTRGDQPSLSGMRRVSDSSLTNRLRVRGGRGERTAIGQTSTHTDRRSQSDPSVLQRPWHHFRFCKLSFVPGGVLLPACPSGKAKTRQHSRLINLMNMAQFNNGVKKTENDTTDFKQGRYDEISNRMESMLMNVSSVMSVIRNWTAPVLYLL